MLWNCAQNCSCWYGSTKVLVLLFFSPFFSLLLCSLIWFSGYCKRKLAYKNKRTNWSHSCDIEIQFWSFSWNFLLFWFANFRQQYFEWLTYNIGKSPKFIRLIWLFPLREVNLFIYFAIPKEIHLILRSIGVIETEHFCVRKSSEDFGLPVKWVYYFFIKCCFHHK